MKTCPGCHATKPLADFHRDKHNPDGRCTRCGACKRAAVTTRRAHTPDPPSVKRAWRLRREYGLTLAAFDAMAQSQGGRCFICGVIPSRLVVDHDHKSGTIRALLCDSCNKSLGNMRDDPALLRAAADYIEAHR